MKLIDFLYSPANNYDDPKVWEFISKGYVAGLFQIAGNLGRKYATLMQPENIDQLAALISIIRPGCLNNMLGDKNMAEVYCARKNGTMPIEYMHPALEPILKDTWGVLIYQESSCQLAKELAGFTIQQAEILRKNMGKKDSAGMAETEKIFLEGAKRVGILNEEEAKEIFSMIRSGERYSFCKCVGKDTIIRRASVGKHKFTYSVEEMYKIRNDIEYAKSTGHNDLRKKWKFLGNYGRALSLCEDGRIRPNTILDIQPAGIRQTFEITLENGSQIKTTDNHKFPTKDGIKTVSKIIDDLKLSEQFFYTCGEYTLRDNANDRGKFSSVTKEELKKNSSNKKVNGQFGKFNYGYTNGSYTEFVKNSKIIPRICKDCGATESKLELHHINGNREDSSIENLVRLCSSCHKKREYAVGRNRRGDVGYPSYLIKIVSITKSNIEETYDVTMEGPNHNFVIDNGIVTCNSHAYEYAIFAYFCAYVKCYLPNKFFREWLRANDNITEVEGLALDAKMFGIDIIGPDLRDLRETFYLRGNKTLQFGLSNIKGVGEAAVKNLVKTVHELEEKLNKTLTSFSWYDILAYSNQFGKTIMEALIKSGALSHLGITRKKMLYEYELIYTKLSGGESDWLYENAPKFTDIISALRSLGRPKKEGGGCSRANRIPAIHSLITILENPPYQLIDTPSYIAHQEKACLGLPVTFSVLDEFDQEVANCSCKDIALGKKDYLVVSCEVGRVKEVKVTKGKSKGQGMAFMDIKDFEGQTSAVCFSDIWKDYKGLLYEGNTVMLAGEASTKDKGIVVKKVWQLEKI